MKNNKKNIIFTNPEEIKKLQNEFDLEHEKINKKIYNSFTEEKLRTSKIIKTISFKAPIEKVFKEVIKISAQDMHNNLEFEDLKENCFYRTSSKKNKIPFKITKLINNECLEVIWYANNQEFIKTLSFWTNKKNTKTKVRYIDFSIGMTSIVGYFEKHIKSIYIKRQIIALKILTLKTKMNLNLIPENKFEKTNIKIENMLNYSKKIY